MRNGIRLSLYILLAAWIAAPGAYGQASPGSKKEPDVLVCGNGETLIGELKSADDTSVTFESQSAGEVTVEWTKIKELHSSKRFAVIPKTVKRVAEESEPDIPRGNVSLSGEQIAVSVSGGRTPRVIPIARMRSVVGEEAYHRTFESPGFFGAWTAEITLGASVVEATQFERTLTGEIKLVRDVPTVDWRTPSNRTSIDFSASYSFSKSLRASLPGVKTTIYEGSAERDQFITPRLYGFGQLVYAHNYSQNLVLGQSYTGGFGWVVFKAPNQRLDFKTSIGYIQRGYYDSAFNKSLAGSIFAESYRYKVESGIELHEELSFIPAWNDSKAYAAAANTGITLPIIGNLSLDIDARDSYLNGVPASYRKNSFQFTTGLTYVLP